MPAYPDALGYINDLAQEEDQGWFRFLCDISSFETYSEPTAVDFESLYSLFTRRASYIGYHAGPISVSATTPNTPDFLEEISGFVSFKRLNASLSVPITKRITLIFGTNGSGKSSLCEALRALADPSAPVRPLHNINVSPHGTPSFTYRLRSNGAPATWTGMAGYGTCGHIFKYFDSSLALKSLVGSFDPGQVVSLIPFKLATFGRLQSLTTALRDHFQAEQRANGDVIAIKLQSVRDLFAAFTGCPLGTISSNDIPIVEKFLEESTDFSESARIEDLRKRIADLQKALSDEGARLLKAEVSELLEICDIVSSLIVCSELLWSFDVPSIDEGIRLKSEARQELEKIVVPAGIMTGSFESILRTASTVCNFEHPESETCPLCRQSLDVTAQELFKQFHQYVAGSIAMDIGVLANLRNSAEIYSQAIERLDFRKFDHAGTIPAEEIEAIRTLVEEILPFGALGANTIQRAFDAVAELKEAVSAIGLKLVSKSLSLAALAEGRDTVLRDKESLEEEVNPLEILALCDANRDLLQEFVKACKIEFFWAKQLPQFTSILRKITQKSKFAHEELIVTDFESRLDGEYRALTNKGLVDFGVILARQGRESTVTVQPKIAGNELTKILSEGEQRVHSLALFFAELETCGQSIVIFDDPVNSFDYNYIANYCRRLRDFMLSKTDRQVVVLTHNWDFFVNIQRTINKTALSGQLSVQVLENCSTSAEYTEKIVDHKKAIDDILALPGEPTTDQKETLAVNMRRLIEAVVNTHVFANQRHQFKQKTLQVSTFREFTKLVALEPTEATGYSDLYSDLSITEHDDPRNAYVNTDKATFSARYNRIVAIEASIVARRIP